VEVGLGLTIPTDLKATIFDLLALLTREVVDVKMVAVNS
jgi:hypothetical protein